MKKEIFELFCAETEKCKILFAKKNHDYGNAYFIDDNTDLDSFGNIKRKFARLKIIYEQKPELQVCETIEDTLRDLAIYSIMEMVRLKCKKQ